MKVKIQREQKEGIEFGLKEYQEIDRYCKEKNIEWFASAWDLESQEFCRQFDLKYNKIASAMIVFEDLLKMVVANLIPSYVPLSEFIKNEDVERKLNVDFFQKWSLVSKRNTLDYLFNKIRSGYFVQIQGGILKQFLPFYNVKFKNTWSQLLNIENLKNPKINENRSEWTATNCLIQLTFKYYIKNILIIIIKYLKFN